MGAMAHSRTRPDKAIGKELATALGRRVDALAQATGRDVVMVAGRDLVALRRAGEWRSWGWEEILNGRWNADQSSFEWTTTGGHRIAVALDEPGRLPEVFRERVQASVVVTESHDLDRGTVSIIGRRRLDGSDTLTWYATASGGASLADDATAAFVVARTDQLARDWG